MVVINRKEAISEIFESLSYFPAVGVLGARQVGKATLVKEIQKLSDKPCKYFDLEKKSDNNILNEAETVFKEFEDYLVIIDEVQLKPELFSALRPAIDENRIAGRFILLGSASPDIIRKSSESLAGRISYFNLHPFLLSEVNDLKKHWLYGGFPNSFLAPTAKARAQWQHAFISSYSYAELPQLGLKLDPVEIANLWTMLATQSGQLLNYSNLAKAFGVSAVTIKSYLNYFRGAFLIDILQPFSFNVKKRIVKAPKIYLNDTGILHSLLSISNEKELSTSANRGFSWETYVVQEIKKAVGDKFQLFFYRTSNGAEVDLVLAKGLKPVCSIEIKYSMASKPQRGFYECIKDLKTENNFVITQTEEDFLFKENVRVVGLERFIEGYLSKIG